MLLVSYKDSTQEQPNRKYIELGREEKAELPYPL
jgi:hypothetical protein